VYRLDSEYQYFLAVAGLGTDSVKSTVRFHVFVDGQKKFASKVFTMSDNALAVCVDVKGGKELKLVVDDAGDTPTNDYAFWGEARLIKN
jgi:hypothetical protein